MMSDKHRYRVACLQTICNPETSRNAVAWFDLEMDGLTRKALKSASEDSAWQGPKPVFADAPDRDSEIWKLLEKERAHAAAE